MSDRLLRQLIDWRDYEYCEGEQPYELLTNAVDYAHDLLTTANTYKAKVAELEGQLSNEECNSAIWMKRAEAAEAESNELKLLLGAAQQYIPQLELEKDAIQGWLNLAHRVADDFEDRANVAEAKLAAVARLELFDFEGNSFDIDELQAALGQG